MQRSVNAYLLYAYLCCTHREPRGSGGWIGFCTTNTTLHFVHSSFSWRRLRFSIRPPVTSGLMRPRPRDRHYLTRVASHTRRSLFIDTPCDARCVRTAAFSRDTHKRVKPAVQCTLHSSPLFVQLLVQLSTPDGQEPHRFNRLSGEGRGSVFGQQSSV